MANDATDPTLPHFKRTREHGREQRLVGMEDHLDNHEVRLSAIEAAKGSKGSGKAFLDLEARVSALEARNAQPEDQAGDPGTGDSAE